MPVSPFSILLMLLWLVLESMRFRELDLSEARGKPEPSDGRSEGSAVVELIARQVFHRCMLGHA